MQFAFVVKRLNKRRSLRALRVAQHKLREAIYSYRIIEIAASAQKRPPRNDELVNNGLPTKMNRTHGPMFKGVNLHEIVDSFVQ